MWSTDVEHNGTFANFDTGKKLGDNDWGHAFLIKPGARIKAHWCGIPWYGDGTHYRVIARSVNKEEFGLRLHQSETDEGDGIHFLDFRTGAPIGYKAFPFAGNRQFALIISGDSEDFSFELQNRQTKNDKREVVKVLTQSLWSDQKLTDTFDLVGDFGRLLCWFSHVILSTNPEQLIYLDLLHNDTG